MPTHRQATVEAFGPPGVGGMGHRTDANLRAAFPFSPLYSEYTPAAVNNAGIAVLNGNGGAGDSIPNIGVSGGVINDGGHTFGVFSLNYPGSPDQETVTTGGGGLPASGYIPNLSSTTPGNISPSVQPEYAGTLPEAGVEFGVGLGGTAKPAATSPNIAGQTIGSYIKGRSYSGSGGLPDPGGA
jgi:hypothetical protein